MILVSMSGVPGEGRIPRESGDDPPHCFTAGAQREYSPRERG